MDLGEKVAITLEEFRTSTVQYLHEYAIETFRWKNADYVPSRGSSDDEDFSFLRTRAAPPKKGWFSNKRISIIFFKVNKLSTPLSRLGYS